MANPLSYTRLRLLALAAMVVLLSTGQLQPTAAQVTCDPVQISWCLQAIVANLPPTADCCQKLKSQESCLCHETADPTFGGFLGLPGAKKVCDSCNVTFPYCH